MSLLRTRWAALGAVVAITLGAGGIGFASIGSGERNVFVPIAPCRVVDTRPASQVGPRSTPLGADETYSVSTHGTNGNCTIPTDAVALSLNITALDATLPTFLTVWATDETRPNASSLNPAPGQSPTPNAVITGLSGTGLFDIYNKQGDVHIVADINGYYADHHHDDRYYTHDEADARFAPASPSEIGIDPFAMQPFSEGTAWSLESSGWWHSSPTGNECIVGPIGLPAGTNVTSISIVYFVPFGNPTIGVMLRGIRDTVGSVAAAEQTVTAATLTAPLTPAAAFERLDIPITQQADVRDDFNYGVTICTAEVFNVLGVDVTVS